MSGNTHKLAQVYGASRGVPETYISRPEIDDRFLNDITRDKHIIIHGGSKQGKTCLRKYHLQEEDCIVIQCTREATKASLYEMILKRAGISCDVSTSTTLGGGRKLHATLEVEGKIPFVGKAGAKGGAEHTKSSQETRETKEFDLDPNDPNEIARVLTEAAWSKLIVIEDFHYLDESVQSAIAVDLKVYHEISALVFIIIGVWLEANRLILYNGDLIGRVTTLNSDQWQDKELRAVVEAGESLLNIDIRDAVKTEIVRGCQKNVGLLQEVCYRLCERHEIWRTEHETKRVGTPEDVADILRALSDEQASRYRNFLHRFSQGLGETQLQMYKWLLWAVINATTDELKSGLRPNTLLSRIKRKHPSKDTLQQNNVTQALERVHTVQFKHRLQPVVLDYSNDELLVVDAHFLIYLQNHDRAELLKNAGFA